MSDWHDDYNKELSCERNNEERIARLEEQEEPLLTCEYCGDVLNGTEYYEYEDCIYCKEDFLEIIIPDITREAKREG